jgi:hypothetical protein
VVIVPSGFPFGGLVFRHGEASMKYEVGRKKAPAALWRVASNWWWVGGRMKSFGEGAVGAWLQFPYSARTGLAN